MISKEEETKKLVLRIGYFRSWVRFAKDDVTDEIGRVERRKDVWSDRRQRGVSLAWQL